MILTGPSLPIAHAIHPAPWDLPRFRPEGIGTVEGTCPDSAVVLVRPQSRQGIELSLIQDDRQPGR